MQHELSEQERKVFVELPPLKAVLSLALPTVISQVITVIYNLADTYYVGQAGDPNKVAALTICMPLMLLMTGMANLYGIGGSSMIARYLGKGDFDRARKSSSFAIWCAAATGIVYSLILLIFRPTVLGLLGANADTYEHAAGYMFWIAIVGSIPTIMNSLLSHLIRAEGMAKKASIGVSMGGILNMILDPLFMFVLMPDGMEIEGAAIATMLSNLSATVFFIVNILKKKSDTVITLDPRKVSLRDGIPGGVFAVGFPSFAMTILSSFSNIVVNNLISTASSAAIAGMGIAKKLNMLSFRVTTGITQGALPLIAFNHSSGRYKRMKQSISIAAGLSMGFALLWMTNSIVMGSTLVRLFINDAETIKYGCSFINKICLAMPLAALTMSSIMMFQAAACKRESMVLSVLRKGVFDVPLMFILNKSYPVIGVAYATPIAEILSVAISAFLVIRFFRGLKKE